MAAIAGVCAAGVVGGALASTGTTTAQPQGRTWGANAFTLTGQTSPVAYTLPHGGARLLWYNPGTHAEQWLFRYSASTFVDVVPFNSIENGPAV